jgi:hypothetical protein
MGNEMFYKIDKCRICGNEDLIEILDLGNQYVSGIFPKKVDLNLYRGPLKLVKCSESGGGCGHVQLEHTFHLPTMYGDEYGYRSGLNKSMVDHLNSKYNKIVDFINFDDNDIVIDIAGNDGTFLGFFPTNLRLLSIDPTSKKFSKYFKDHVKYTPNFFSEDLYRQNFGNEKAKLVTSFSMFYDLENPCQFAKEVNNILDPEKGIWVLEQSYMPTMVDKNSFDTICHEHLSYYGMKQMKYIFDHSNFKIVDFEFNDVNGGSVSIVVANKNSQYVECSEKLNSILKFEIDDGYNTVELWKKFEDNINSCKIKFFEIVNQLKTDGLRIAALGASTKGNITLQTWNLSECIEVIGDVNPEKNGSFTPGTWIPIKDENSVIDQYDVFVILPWHFRNFFMNAEKFKGKKLLFPLPNPELITV